MTKDQERGIYKDAISRYGLQGETLMLAEECAELTKACSKSCRAMYDGNAEKAAQSIMDIAEEIADVEVVIGQMKYYYNIPDELIEKIKTEKLERLRRRMDGQPD